MPLSQNTPATWAGNLNEGYLILLQDGAKNIDTLPGQAIKNSL